MKHINKNNQLTNYRSSIKLEPNESIRLGKYSVYKESDKFLLKERRKKNIILAKFNSSLKAVKALIKIKKKGDKK